MDNRSETKGLESNGCEAVDIPKNGSGLVRPNYVSTNGWVQPNFLSSSSKGWVQSDRDDNCCDSFSNDNYCTSFTKDNYHWVSFSRICVEGYDTSLREYDLKLALRKHFASCGDIPHIYVPRDYVRDSLKSFAFIHIMGEGAEEKALALSGSDVGGWNVFVKSSPFDGQYVDPGWATVQSPRFSLPHRTMIVTGYDTSLPEIDIQIGLCKHFSSCGEITDIMVYRDANGIVGSNSLIYILGEGALEKALELSGCDVGGWNISIVLAMPPPGIKVTYGSSSSLPLPPIKTTRTKKKKSTKEYSHRSRL